MTFFWCYCNSISCAGVDALMLLLLLLLSTHMCVSVCVWEKNANACIFSLIAKRNRFTYREYSFFFFCSAFSSSSSSSSTSSQHHIVFAFVIFFFLSHSLRWYGFLAVVVVIVVVHTLLLDPSLFNWLTTLDTLSRSICWCDTHTLTCISCVCRLSLSLFFIILFIVSYRFILFFDWYYVLRVESLVSHWLPYQKVFKYKIGLQFTHAYS